MNQVDFYSKINEIDGTIALTKFKLKNNNSFPNALKLEFGQALNELSELLITDRMHPLSSKESWHFAYRIVHLKNIQLNLEKIKNRILEVNNSDIFVKEINSIIIFELEGRIKDLKTEMESKERLPFSHGMERDQFFESVQQSLQLKNIQQIFEVQREYFHLLGNYFDNNQLRDVNIAAHSGNFSINSLISWQQVLNLFVKEGDAAEKKVGSTLLSIINEAMPFDVKNTFAYKLDQITSKVDYFKNFANFINQIELMPDDAEEEGYFKDYLESHQPKESYSLTKEQFFNKYQLGSKSFVPERVIINEMAWDMVDRVSSLKNGETKLFSLGTRNHCIVVQVTCIGDGNRLNKKSSAQKNALSAEKIYEYKVFNTGDGTEYHLLGPTGMSVHPLIYKEVPSSALSYSFFSTLLRYSLEGVNVNAFYQFHDRVLIQEAGGEKDFMSGALYPLQKYAICSYTAVEAWINSYLNEKQMRHFEVIKTKISTSKQEEVVRILGQEEPNIEEEGPINGQIKRQRPHYIEELDIHIQRESKRRRVQESKTLLNLGHQHLQQLIENYNLSSDDVKMDLN